MIPPDISRPRGRAGARPCLATATRRGCPPGPPSRGTPRRAAWDVRTSGREALRITLRRCRRRRTHGNTAGSMRVHLVPAHVSEAITKHQRTSMSSVRAREAPLCAWIRKRPTTSKQQYKSRARASRACRRGSAYVGWRTMRSASDAEASTRKAARDDSTFAAARNVGPTTATRGSSIAKPRWHTHKAMSTLNRARRKTQGNGEAVHVGWAATRGWSISFPREISFRLPGGPSFAEIRPKFVEFRPSLVVSGPSTVELGQFRWPTSGRVCPNSGQCWPIPGKLAANIWPALVGFGPVSRGTIWPSLAGSGHVFRIPANVDRARAKVGQSQVEIHRHRADVGRSQCWAIPGQRWPVKSWGPNLAESVWLRAEFGRCPANAGRCRTKCGRLGLNLGCRS